MEKILPVSPMTMTMTMETILNKLIFNLEEKTLHG